MTHYIKKKKKKKKKNAWQMGHNSRQGFILGQELLLDFAAWIGLTSNADNSVAADISCVGS